MGRPVGSLNKPRVEQYADEKPKLCKCNPDTERLDDGGICFRCGKTIFGKDPAVSDVSSLFAYVQPTLRLVEGIDNEPG